MKDRLDGSDEQSHESRKQVKQSVAEADELERFMLKVLRRLPGYMRRCSITPELEGSAEWMSKLGMFWWNAREERGVSRSDVAVRMRVPEDNVRFLEFGLAEQDELKEDFLRGYSLAIGAPEIYDQFQEKFPNVVETFPNTK